MKFAMLILDPIPYSEYFCRYRMMYDVILKHAHMLKIVETEIYLRHMT